MVMRISMIHVRLNSALIDDVAPKIFRELINSAQFGRVLVSMVEWRVALGNNHIVKDLT